MCTRPRNRKTKVRIFSSSTLNSVPPIILWQSTALTLHLIGWFCGKGLKVQCKMASDASVLTLFTVGLYKYDFFLIFIILHGLINASIWVDSENIWMEPPAFVKNVRTSSKDWAFCSKNRYLDMRFSDIHQHLTSETRLRRQIFLSPNGVGQNWSKLLQ